MPERQESVLIRDEDLLWRRILDTPKWWTFNPDGSVRPSSASFKLRNKADCNGFEKGVSVQLSRLTTFEIASSVIPSAGIAEIPASFPRQLGLEVIHDAIFAGETAADNDPSHSLISPIGEQRISKGQANQLAKECRMILLPATQRL